MKAEKAKKEEERKRKEKEEKEKNDKPGVPVVPEAKQSRTLVPKKGKGARSQSPNNGEKRPRSFFFVKRDCHKDCPSLMIPSCARRLRRMDLLSPEALRQKVGGTKSVVISKSGIARGGTSAPTRARQTSRRRRLSRWQSLLLLHHPQRRA